MLENKDIEKLAEVFATKEDIKEFSTKEDIIGFKDEILDGQDGILEKLGLLLQEKTVGDSQDKKQKTVLEIHNRALKEHSILSPQDVEKVAKLEFF